MVVFTRENREGERWLRRAESDGLMKEEEEEEEEEVVFTRNRGGSAQHATCEEAIFISVVSTNEDPPNAHQAQQRPNPRVR